MDPDAICDRSDLTVRSCNHCRKSAAYVPADQGLAVATAGMTLDGVEELHLSIDAMGAVWAGSDSAAGVFVSPEEAFQRSKFGKGRPRTDPRKAHG